MTNRLKVIEYFEALVNEVDLKAEYLLDKYVSNNHENVDEEKKQLEEQINERRHLFIDTIEQLKTHNLDFLDVNNDYTQPDDNEKIFDKYCLILDKYDIEMENVKITNVEFTSQDSAQILNSYAKDINETFGYLVIVEDGVLIEQKLALLREIIFHGNFSKNESKEKIENKQNNNFYQTIANSKTLESNIFDAKFDEVFKNVTVKFCVFEQTMGNFIIRTTESELFKVNSVSFADADTLPTIKQKAIEMFFKNSIPISIGDDENTEHVIDEDRLIQKLNWLESNLNVASIDLHLSNENQINFDRLLQVKSLQKLSLYVHDNAPSICEKSKLKVLKIIRENWENLNMPYENFIELEELELSLYVKTLHSNALNGLVRLKKLNLSNNSLESIDESIFNNNLPNLIELDLSFNPIRKIENGAFSSLHSLKKLIMNHLSIDSIGELFFNGLTSLETLEISLEIDEAYYQSKEHITMHPKAFAPLKNLTSLSAKQIKSNNVQLAHLTKLKRLNMLHFSGYISFDSIQTLLSLEELHLFIGDTISSLSIFTQLRKINLFNSKIQNLDSFNGLLNLEEIKILWNRFSNVNSNLFQNLPNLTVLNLCDNGIGIIEPGAFDHLTNLKKLNLSRNSISSIKANVFNKLVNLERLNLEQNPGIVYIEDYAFNGLKNLRYLNMYNLKLDCLNEHQLHGLGNLRVLFLNANQITRIHSNAFDTLTNLQELRLDRNQIEELDAMTFRRLANLKALYLFGNRIKSIKPGTFDSLCNLRRLSLLQNQIKTFELNSFHSLERLTHLGLDTRRMEQVDCMLFEKLHALEKIYIDDEAFERKGLYDANRPLINKQVLTQLKNLKP